MSMHRRSLRVAVLLAGLLPATLPAAERASVAFDGDARPRLKEALAVPGCGSALTPEEAAAYIRYREEHPLPGGEILGGPYFVPIAPHIVRMSDGTGGLPESRYQQAIADANGHYAPVGITFYTLGAIDYIDSDAFYTTSTLDEINDLRTTNTVPDAINIYFTENLNYESGGLCGISAFTFSSVQAIAMRNSCTANPSGLGNHSTFSHEVGHYFNLFHTHETALGEEFVDGSNCLVAGDELCDTPADPVLTSGTVSSTTCQYTGSEVDGHGDPYDPDCALLMSYSLKHCRDAFTPDSYVRIENTLVNERPELVTSPGSGAPERAAAPAGVTLAAPRPNPSGGVSGLRFTLAAPSRVEITVFDVRGARIRTVARAFYPEGEHAAGWDGLDEAGNAVTPGIYFARLTAGDESVTRKIQRLR